MSDRVLAASRSFPALILTGARQTGKTSLLRRLFPDHRYVSLDSPLLAEQAETSAESFLRDHPPPVVIDEVQYAPGLFRQLKIAIDANRQAKGRFILTGSQKFTLMRGVSDSLAGRCAILGLPGLTAREIASIIDLSDSTAYTELLLRGSLPELWAERTISSREYQQSYVATYLERDLRQVLNVGSLRDFERFMRACAARTSQQLNKSSLARDVGISQATASEWLSALEASNQITLLEPFFGDVGKRLVKSPKLYFNDTGLLCFLLGVSVDAIGGSALTEPIWENFVFAELSKHLALHHPEWSLWFYRDQQGREADFLIQGPHSTIRLLDAKWSELPRQRDYAALEAIASILARASNVNELSTTIIGRMRGITRARTGRFAVSALALGEFLGPTWGRSDSLCSLRTNSDVAGH